MYISFLTGTDEITGYSRVKGDLDKTMMFAPIDHCCEITGIASYDSETGGDPIEVVELSEPVFLCSGMIPIAHNRKVLKGVATSAKILTNSEGAFVKG